MIDWANGIVQTSIEAREDIEESRFPAQAQPRRVLWLLPTGHIVRPRERETGHDTSDMMIYRTRN